MCRPRRGCLRRSTFVPSRGVSDARPVCLLEGFATFFSRRPKGPLDVSSPGNGSFSLNGRMTGLFALHCRIQTEGMSEGRSLQRRAFRRSSIEVRRAGRNLESRRRLSYHRNIDNNKGSDDPPTHLAAGYRRDRPSLGSYWQNRSAVTGFICLRRGNECRSKIRYHERRRRSKMQG